MGRAREDRIPSFSLYGEAPRGSGDLPLHIETIAARSRPHHWKIHPHFHRSLHQLLCVDRGGGVARAESDATRFRAPALILVPAGAVHGFDFEPGTRGFVVSIADDLLRDIARREPAIGALFQAPEVLRLSAAAMRSTVLPRTFRMFAREFARSSPARLLALEALVAVILANVLRLSHTHAEAADANAGRHRLLVARFRELIESEYCKNASLAEYAAALNVSESRLRSACLAVTEQAPMQLVHARIVLEAKRQLLYTSMKVCEVAYTLGFDDPAYFTRFFSRRTGVSPRTFRARSCGPADGTVPRTALSFGHHGPENSNGPGDSNAPGDSNSAARSTQLRAPARDNREAATPIAHGR